jgi:hypothetical protein
VDAVIASGQCDVRAEPPGRPPGRRRAFGAPSTQSPSVPIAEEPRFLTLADLNGDRRLDAVVTHTNGVLSFLLNTGDGGFGKAPVSQHYLGTEAFGLVIADVDHDSSPDLVAATVNSVTVLLSSEFGMSSCTRFSMPGRPGAYNDQRGREPRRQTESRGVELPEGG